MRVGFLLYRSLVKRTGGWEMVRESEYLEEDWQEIDDIYSNKLVGQLKENDELFYEEEEEEENGFMRGYNLEEESGFMDGYGGV